MCLESSAVDKLDSMETEHKIYCFIALLWQQSYTLILAITWVKKQLQSTYDTMLFLRYVTVSNQYILLALFFHIPV